MPDVAGTPAAARFAGGSGPGRFRRAVARGAAGVGLAIVFATASVGAIALHLDLPATRRLVQARVNALLATALDGHIEVGRIDSLSLSGAKIDGATAFDPHGQPVVRASGIEARADVLALVLDALAGKGVLSVEIPLVRIGHADVLVEMHDDGHVNLEETFRPREPHEPKPPKAPVPGRAIEIALRRIEIDTVWAHGRVAPPRALDADLNRLVASVVAGPHGATVDVEPTGLADRTFLFAPTNGTIEYHLRVIPEPRAAEPGGVAPPPVQMWTRFGGRLGSIEVLARATIEGNHLTATADVPRAEPEQLDALLPGSPFREPLSATVDLEGDVPDLALRGRVGLHDASKLRGEIAFDGRLAARGPVGLEIDARASGIDPRTFGASLPEGKLGGTARVRIEVAETGPRLSAEVQTEPGTFAGGDVPAADVFAVLDRGVLSGTATVHEPGAETRGIFVVDAGAVRFDADAEVPSIRDVPRLAAPLGGAATVHVAGSFVHGELDARVRGSASGLVVPGGVKLDHASVDGRVAGRLDELSVEASATGGGLDAAGTSYAKVTATAEGPLASPRLTAKLHDDATGDVTASGRLDARAASVRSVAVRVERGGSAVEGTIARVGATPAGVGIEGVSLSGEGIGKIDGALTVSHGDLVGKLRGQDVDLSRLAKLVGLSRPLKGIADVDVELTRGRHGRSGHVQVELEDGDVSLLSGVSASVSATIKDDEVEANGLVRLVAHASPAEPEALRCDGAIATVRFSDGKGRLTGPLLDPRTYEALHGSVDVTAEDWNLRCLARLVPIGLPVSHAAGRLDAHVSIVRPEGQRFASLRDVQVRTRGLQIAGAKALLAEKPAWESEHVDVTLRASVDGVTGATEASLAFYDDAQLGELAVSTHLNLPVLLGDPTRRWTSLAAAPLQARLAVPRRPVRSFVTLPSIVADRLPPLTGDVRVDAYLDGSLAAPFLTVRAMGWGVSPASSFVAAEASPWGLPVDVDALVTYDGQHATADAHVTRTGKEIATANAELDADLAALAKGQDVPWTGGVYAKLVEVPLGDVPFLGDHDVAGHVSGTIALADLNRKPTLKVDLDLPDLRVGSDLFFEKGQVSLRIDRPPNADRDTGIAKVLFVGQDGGSFELVGYSSVGWKDGLVPAVDDDRPGDLFAHLSKFRLAAFHPLVADVLSELDGLVDGDVRVGWKRLDEGDEGTVEAKLKLADGIVHIPQLGQELRHARATITSAPGGVLRFDDIFAEGTTGHIAGWALARLDGLVFRDAAANFVVPQGSELPLTLEGVPVGQVHAQIAVQAEKHERQIDMKIKIPTIELDLPASPKKGVQSLDDAADIVVSHARSAPKEPRSPDALAWVMDVDVADMRVLGTGIDLRFRSSQAAPPHVELTDKLRTSGELELLDGGRFLVLGKQFYVDRGLIRLSPVDPSNPFVAATAHWDAPGLRVFVDYGPGDLLPATREKLRFRSSPSMPEQELVTILLLGETEQQAAIRKREQGSGPQGSEAAGGIAVGVGGDIASQQFNQLLSGIAPLRGLSTRIGTTNQGAVKTSLVYELSDSFNATASYEGATSSSQAQAGAGGSAPAAGAAGAQRSGGRTELSVDWHFKRGWALPGDDWLLRWSVGYSPAGGVGDYAPSTGVDVLWQYRY